MFVFPDAEVLRTDAAFRKNGRCFRQYEPRPADCATSKVNKVPIVGVTIDARILTHRRDKHTVAELEIANGEGIKKMWHEVYATSFVTPLSSFRRSTSAKDGQPIPGGCEILARQLVARLEIADGDICTGVAQKFI